MRHATERDLDQLDGLMTRLRAVPGLRERRRGSFSRGSRALLHFHADGADLYADVRLEEDFERVRVTSDAEQAQLLSRLRDALGAQG